eukprot:479643-Pleurochrysis_carterae.AAC.2
MASARTDTPTRLALSRMHKDQEEDAAERQQEVCKGRRGASVLVSTRCCANFEPLHLEIEGRQRLSRAAAEHGEVLHHLQHSKRRVGSQSRRRSSRRVDTAAATQNGLKLAAHGLARSCKRAGTLPSTRRNRCPMARNGVAACTCRQLRPRSLDRPTRFCPKL